MCRIMNIAICLKLCNLVQNMSQNKSAWSAWSGPRFTNTDRQEIHKIVIVIHQSEKVKIYVKKVILSLI